MVINWDYFDICVNVILLFQGGSMSVHSDELLAAHGLTDSSETELKFTPPAQDATEIIDGKIQLK